MSEGKNVVKVCGATTSSEVVAIAQGGGTHVGLWWHLAGAEHELTSKKMGGLARQARSEGLIPVLVTFSADPSEIAKVASTADIDWIQLHAFQGPLVVSALRDMLGDSVVIIKALHVNPDGTSPDLRFAAAHRRAGANMFLLDAIQHDRVGSTGEALKPATINAAVFQADHPFLLAGGLDGKPSPEQLQVRALSLFRGIDVDSGARGSDGTICSDRVSDLVAAWTMTDPAAVS
jgi:phosphoribosylanthranilate isomerase